MSLSRTPACPAMQTCTGDKDQATFNLKLALKLSGGQADRGTAQLAGRTAVLRRGPVHPTNFPNLQMSSQFIPCQLMPLGPTSMAGLPRTLRCRHQS